MSAAKLKNFLQALESVKQDLTCGVCSELCKNAVTLSNCLHMICREHFEGLKNCPTCNVSLDGCKMFEDKLEHTIAGIKELDDTFKCYSMNLLSEQENCTPEKKSIIATKKTKKINTQPELSNDNDNPNLQFANKSDVPSKHKGNHSTKSANKKNITNATIKLTANGSLERSSANYENLNASYLSNLTNAKLNKTLEKRNSKGETALHIACRVGNLDKVMELLNKGANTNTKDYAGWTPLHEAVQNGQLNLVTVLLQHNALINVPGQGNETPLHEAIRYGHEDIVKELITHGADINIRNIKGETPRDLAQGKMKETLESAAENIVHTQSVNVTHISNLHSQLSYDDIRVYCVTKSAKIRSKLKLLKKNHDNLCVEATFTKNVTHLIVDTEDNLICTSTMDVLEAITHGLWVISSDWISNSTELNLEPFENYEVVGVGKDTYNGPRNARYNKYKQLPGLFDGCHFYLHNFTLKYEISKYIVLTKAILAKLITDAGGKVLRRVPNPEMIPEAEKLIPYHAKKDGMLVECSHYIIYKDMYEPRYNMKHLKALPVGWLIECIEKYELCDPN